MALPSSGYFSDPNRTVGEMQQALEDQRDVIAGKDRDSVYYYAVSQFAAGDDAKVGFLDNGVIVDALDYVVYPADLTIWKTNGATGTSDGTLNTVTGAAGGVTGLLVRVGGLDKNSPNIVSDNFNLMFGNLPTATFPNSGCGLAAGGADGATATNSNIKLATWHGIGIAPTVSGHPVPKGENATWFNARTGNAYTRGNWFADSDKPVWHSGNFNPGSKQDLLSGVSNVELGSALSGDRNSIIDLHSSDGVDYNARIRRAPGINGDLEIYQEGPGDINIKGGGFLKRNGSVVFDTSNLTASGVVSVLTGAPSPGETLPLPAGYTQAQCAFFSMVYGSNGSITATRSSVDRTVPLLPAGYVVSGSSYIVIGVK